MPIKIEEPTQQQINELRNLFIKKYETNPPIGKVLTKKNISNVKMHQEIDQSIKT